MITLGLDVGGTTIKGGRVDPGGRIEQSATRTTEVSDLGALVETLVDLVGELALSGRVDAVGLGLPGLRNSDTGEIVVSPNIPALEGVNMERRLGERLGIPVLARNDADMSAWGEFSVGAGQGTRHMIGLTLGTGVGSGIILDGRLYNGSRGYAAEAGHITVDPEGLACSCGSRGCLEAVASATGIVALARAWFGPEDRKDLAEPWSAARIAEAAHKGHEGARKVFEQAGRYLGTACATLINLLNPEAIVIAGGVARAGDLILGPAIREAKLRAFDASFEACRILPARLAEGAGIVGAALYVRQTLEADREAGPFRS